MLVILAKVELYTSNMVCSHYLQASDQWHSRKEDFPEHTPSETAPPPKDHFLSSNIAYFLSLHFKAPDVHILVYLLAQPHFPFFSSPPEGNLHKNRTGLLDSLLNPKLLRRMPDKSLLKIFYPCLLKSSRAVCLKSWPGDTPLSTTSRRVSGRWVTAAVLRWDWAYGGPTCFSCLHLRDIS